MQYSKGCGDANRLRNGTFTRYFNPMMRMLPRLAFGATALLLACSAGGCSGSLPGIQPLQKFSDLIRPYNKTLTKAEQTAAINELQDEAEKHQNTESEVETTASVTPAAAQ